MKIKTCLLVCSVSFLAACTSAPGDVAYTDPEIREYRLFLSALEDQVGSVNSNAFDHAKVNDLLVLRDRIMLVIGNARTFGDMGPQRYARFVRLNQELYRRMGSDHRFVANRAKLYEMLLTPPGHQRDSVPVFEPSPFILASELCSDTSDSRLFQERCF